VEQEWGDWPEHGYGDETTDDLGGTEHPLTGGGSDDALSGAGLDGYDEPAGVHDGYGAEPHGGDPSGGHGYLEDDPMSAFDHNGGDAGDHADPGGVGELHDAPEPADAGHPDAGHPDEGHLEDVRSPDELETVVGADPDVDPNADWATPEFPDHLDLRPPDPVDGYPWSDAAVLAPPGSGGSDPGYEPHAAPPAGELLDYAGDEGGPDPWSALVGSDDPATSSLARWWAPGS
jgi:hypothetical protein